MTSPSPTPHPEPLEALPATSDLLVIGAGAMGGWTAYRAAAGGGGPDRSVGGGRSVTLLDAWGAGHARATSGDESRIIRSAHGVDPLYTRWSRRAREVWQETSAEWAVELFVQNGVLWFAHREGGFEDESAVTLTAEGVPHERLPAAELLARWPQLGDGGGLTHALYEPEAGTLRARLACQAVTAAFQRAGGRYGLAGVRPGRIRGGQLLDVVDGAGRRWSAGSFVFACGPWLPRLFPDVAGDLVRVTKQDVVFVGPREADRRYHAEALPTWADYDAAYYGIPALDERGFKLAPDRLGPIFDPSNGERVVDPESIRLVRRYLRQRFPGLADGPVLETRVCQYESTPDAHFVLDRHPGLANVWLAGGGSGHGFKHGPRIGEYLVARIDGVPLGGQEGALEERFQIRVRTPSAAARTGGDEMGRSWELF
ncbi:MAG TPA: FAD-dependent oxidoreductase [Candidatus Limnocylindrales bacterium]|nr:FAD-dependent oxidoreductase [Candidatus Limnocylindrales bacterium]